MRRFWNHVTISTTTLHFFSLGNGAFALCILSWCTEASIQNIQAYKWHFSKTQPWNLQVLWKLGISLCGIDLFMKSWGVGCGFLFSPLCISGCPKRRYTGCIGMSIIGLLLVVQVTYYQRCNVKQLHFSWSKRVFSVAGIGAAKTLQRAAVSSWRGS